MTREERWQQIGRGGEGGYVYGGRASLPRLALHMALSCACFGGGLWALGFFFWPVAALWGLIVLAVIGNYALERHCRAVVEADSLRVDPPLRPTVSVAWPDVMGAVSGDAGAVLVRRDGSHVRVVFWPLDGAELRALIEHIAERAGLEEITGRPELIRRFIPEAQWPVRAAGWRARDLPDESN